MATPVLWSPPPKSLTLAEKELHVWRASLSCSEAALRRLKDSLLPEERKRADKFLVLHARDDFVATRGILRELLGRYLELPASEIVMKYGQYGKPSISLADPARQIRFNVSHSHGHAEIGRASCRERV